MENIRENPYHWIRQIHDMEDISVLQIFNFLSDESNWVTKVAGRHVINWLPEL